MHAAVLELPTNQQRYWLGAFGAAAVFIVNALAGSPCAVGATQDLAKTLAAQRRSLGQNLQLVRVWWTSSSATALELATAVALAPGATVEETEAAVRESARRLGIPLAEHEPTLARARAAIAKLDRGLALAKATGTLSFFNSRYKFCRRKAQAEGRPFLSYGTAHSRLKSEIARRIAEAGSGTLTLKGIVDAVLPLK
jgi:hypothetical protein